MKNLPPLTDRRDGAAAALLTDPTVPKAGHNIKYDWQVLRRAGVELAGVAFDTMLESFILDPGRRSHAIDNLCLEHLGRHDEDLPGRGGEGEDGDPLRRGAVFAAAEYCGADSATVLALHELFAPALREVQMEDLLRDVEMPLVEVLVDMEWEGISVDRALFARLDGELGADLRRLEGEISRVAGDGPQHQLSAPARDHPVREAAAPGAQEDQDRPVAPTPTCWSSSPRWGTSCPGSSWSTASSRS